MLELNITSNYLDRAKVYAKDRIGLIFFFFVGIFRDMKGSKGTQRMI
jgi:hypothetical protein